MSLSDKSWEVNSNTSGDPNKDAIDVKDVKEFIKKLKEDVKDNSLDGLITMDFVLLWIDKLAGDDLK